jgi:hypothetical protein
MHILIKRYMKYIYEFTWYELDQSVKVGQESEFYFFKNGDPPQFYCGLFDPGKTEMRKCLIKSISHPDLGEILEIDTKGLDYTITLANGNSFQVEAEESPGEVYNYSVKPKSWIFEINVKQIA